MLIPHLFVIVHVFTLNCVTPLRTPTFGVATDQVQFWCSLLDVARQHVCACASAALQGICRFATLL